MKTLLKCSFPFFSSEKYSTKTNSLWKWNVVSNIRLSDSLHGPEFVSSVVAAISTPCPFSCFNVGGVQCSDEAGFLGNTSELTEFQGLSGQTGAYYSDRRGPWAGNHSASPVPSVSLPFPPFSSPLESV